MSKQVLFTMDIDWVSEPVMKYTMDFIDQLNIPFLVFQTHISKCLIKNTSPLITLELHPNFCEGSDHGNSINDVIKTIFRVPHKGLSVRAHKYYMPNEALNQFIQRDYTYTLNNFTNLNFNRPFMITDELIEINTFFEDGIYLKNKHPLDVNFVIDKMKSDGLYVFNIHPIHMVFNEKDYQLTRNFKDNMTKKEYQSITADFIEKNKFNGYGIASFIKDLVNALKLLEFDFLHIGEVKI